MDYKKNYERLINSRKKLSREKSGINYYENHHILPKSLGGINDKENLVLLTPKEHFIAHLLLTKCYEGKERQKMVYALWRLTRSSKKNYSAKKYDEVKLLFYKYCSGNKHSMKTKNKISESQKERWSNLSKKEKEIFCEKLSKLKKGKPSKNKGKTLEEIVGESRAKELKKQSSEKRKGITWDQRFGIEASKKKKEEKSKRFLGKKFTGKRLETQLNVLKKIHENRRLNPDLYKVSEKTKQKMREQRKGTKKGELNPMFGKCWITKDNENKVIKKDEIEIYIKKGWSKGKVQKKKNQ